jgi:hypothetical protein
MESQANSGFQQWGTHSAHVIYTDSVARSGANMYPLSVQIEGLLPVKAPGAQKRLLPSISKVIYTDDVLCTGSQMYPLVILPVLKCGQQGSFKPQPHATFRIISSGSTGCSILWRNI